MIVNAYIPLGSVWAEYIKIVADRSWQKILFKKTRFRLLGVTRIHPFKNAYKRPRKNYHGSGATDLGANLEVLLITYHITKTDIPLSSQQMRQMLKSSSWSTSLGSHTPCRDFYTSEAGRPSRNPSNSMLDESRTAKNQSFDGKMAAPCQDTSKINTV